MYPTLRRFVALLIVGLGGLAGLKLEAADTPRPNVVLILADDLGWADVGFNGSTFHQTPHLDRLAREGIRFTSAYAAGPVCSPTRAALLTGQSPARLHLTDWLPGRPDNKNQKLSRPALNTNLPAAAVTLAEALRGAGYRTAHIGKWHLGGTNSRPQDHGFQFNVAGDHTGTPLSYKAPFRRDGQVMPGLEEAPSGEYLTDRLTAEAEQFIETSRNEPFFLYLAHYAVHIPLTAKDDLVAKYRARPPGATQSNAIYAAMVDSVDQSVGRILKKLAALGLDERTLVVFSSDNGGLSVREGAHTPATSNSPWRAGKGYLYEGGLRVPLAARWPGVIPAGQINDTPVISTDWLPTVLELSGVASNTNTKTNNNAPLDGVSLAASLKGGAAPAREALFWHYPHYANQGGKPAGAVRAGDWKLIEHYESGYLELFNLEEDRSETTNRAGAFPDRANALAKKLADWRKSVGAQMMTTNSAYEAVPVAQRADRHVVLPAHEAIIHGATVRYEPPAHKNTVGYWVKPSDWVEWVFSVREPGTFAVEMLQGCGKGSGGSEVEVTIDGQPLRFTVQDTGHFQNFVRREIGTVHLKQAGRYNLTVKPQTKPGVAVMDLRQVVLRPVK